tara:strand:+ start:4690 stop:5733 length:1044 start_codon:yes stop_codon:yes gene_type:complete
VKSIVVSSAIPVRFFSIDKLSINFYTDDVCFSKIISIGSGALRRFSASFSYFFYAKLYVRKDDVVIFYNPFPEYILAALYLKLTGRPAVLDLEDIPIFVWNSPSDVVYWLSWKLLISLCQRRYLTASRSIGERCNYSKFLPVHGVVPINAKRTPKRLDGDRLEILFGGTINQGAGLGLFVDAVSLLCDLEPDLPVRFVITGYFPIDYFSEFARRVMSESNFEFEILPNLTMSEYRNLVDRVDVGLSLKLPSQSVGTTTFPSKLIEYAAYGLLVCTLPVGDVLEIFSETTACILESEDPKVLANAILSVVREREKFATIAGRGCDVIFEKYTRHQVGRQILEFLGEKS